MLNQRLQSIYENWLEEASIDGIQDLFVKGTLTSRELVLMYLERIKEWGQAVNAILEINPDALQIAEALDYERKTKGTRGALHGIPIIIKDNIDTGDKMHTSAGSLALQNSFASADSAVAECLRKAGGVILGKANMTEWANFIADRMKSGYSSRGGQVENPYGIGKFDVGGSSSGSAAAVAANLAAASVGTETSGSILSPASSNSVVGIKPTVGLISRRGIIPISHTQDTAGPMGRTVKDAAILLGALSARDESDPVTLSNPLAGFDFTTSLNKDALKGKRIGILRDYFNYLDNDKKAVLNEAIRVLEVNGAVIVDEAVLPSMKHKWSYEVLKYEFKPNLNAYLGKLPASVPYRTLSDLIRFNEDNKEQMLKYGQAIFIESDKTSGSLTEAEYLNALSEDQYYSKEAGIDKMMADLKLDAYVYPNNFACGIAAKAGYPSVTVPAGYSGLGEPVGITFSGPAYSEPVLIAIAYAYEQASKMRKPPVIKGNN